MTDDKDQILLEVDKRVQETHYGDMAVLIVSTYADRIFVEAILDPDNMSGTYVSDVLPLEKAKEWCLKRVREK